MALPKIDVPTFEIAILGTDNKITCRPFLVKESNILTLAIAAEDQKEMLRACKQVIKNCSYDEIDVDSLAMYQLQDIFLKLKIKSVGELQSFELACGSCGDKIQYDMNLGDFKVVGDITSLTKKIKFSESTGMVLKYPSAELTIEMADLSDVEVLVNCIDYIYDSEEITRPDADNAVEIVEYVDTIPLGPYEEAEQFFSTIPTLAHNIEFKCRGCETNNQIVVNGIEHFFA